MRDETVESGGRWLADNETAGQQIDHRLDYDSWTSYLKHNIVQMAIPDA